MNENKEKNVNSENTNIVEKTNIQKKQDYIFWLYLIIYVVGIVIGYFFKFQIGYIVSVITIVTAKIKYPKNIAIKIIFWLTIIALILFFIFLIWLLYTCGKIADGCNSLVG